MPGLGSIVLIGAAAAAAASASASASSPQAPLLSLGGGRSRVDPQKLQDSISAENLKRRAEDLYEIAKRSEEDWGHPTRVIGSPGHRGTLDYIRSTLERLDGYYSVSDQPFPAVVGSVREAKLVIGNEVPNTTAFSLTPPTRHHEPVHGGLVWVGGTGCERGDYPDEADGAVVLVRRGDCSFGDKSDLAGRAGAVALVVANNEAGDMHGTLGTPSPHQVATFGLSRADADRYIERLERGDELDAIAYMDATVDSIETANIIAQTVDGDDENCVMLGGHSDGVAEGPGINDDGSGSLSVLEVAVQLSRFGVNNCVRFAWWAAEEEGLIGSNHYVASLTKDENRRIRLFQDYDMMASPNFGYQVYNATDDSNPAGSEKLRDLYISWFDNHGLNHTLIPFDGRSDYDGFIRHGIPAGGVTAGADGTKTEAERDMFGGEVGDWFDPCYHQACDDIGNLNMTAWETNTKLMAHTLASLALSLDGFPEREPANVAEKQPRKTKYLGHKLFM
ncbi:hypothetical protein L249_6535 [Ophiocordyceps polyrhachis-furcata BCC 54312]|uniref:Peptide hydrolase n=1 Tax=Ophiocordyceps polyrhachis-furcata BCC 54312 TaxID=1330021 RepID=A0A367LKA8_9HYPO|nr:hypothetical protein L249_6535 [Ophiocordyceps polyrhachis-furcata BCC 54312]